MKISNKAIWCSIIVCLLGGAACKTAPARPDWAGRMWQEKQNMLVSGISSGCEDVSCAQKTAYANALADLAQYMGVRVSVHTRVNVQSDGQSVEAVYQAYTQELNLKHLNIEKFEAVRGKQGLTGYILLSVPQQELASAKKQLEISQAQAEAEQRRKHQKGYFYVSAPKNWPDLAGGMEKILRQQGYLVGRRGQAVRLQVAFFKCLPSAAAQLSVCTLQVEVESQGRKQRFTAKGFGAPAARARADCLENWLSGLPKNVLE